jgi:arylsulfatase A-like enzyme
VTDRPNILLVITDHTNAETVAPGGPCRTPNLDALAAEGLRFHRCTTTNAICSPARASLMTGLYPSAHGMWDCTHTQRAEWVDVPAGRFTYFSHILAENGYHNAYFGKWHVEQSNRLEDFGWHEYDLSVNGARGPAQAGSEVVVPKPGYRDYLLAGIAADEAIQTHPGFDRGIDFLQRHSRERPEQPFCCVVSTIEPHDAYVPPQRFVDLYDEASEPLAATLHDDPAGKPEVVRRLRSVWSDMTERDWRRMTVCYRAVVSFLDHEMGRLLAVLKETGLEENTLVLFTSDHGDMLGAHGLVAKGIGTGYEEVYNIPLLIRAPGQTVRGEAPRVRTSLVDLGPTILDYCGLPPLPEAHGRSLRPVLEGTAAAEEWQDAYAEFFGQRFVYTQRLVWHGDWKYVFNPGGVDELYNLAEDPHERDNLAERPEHRETLEAMCKRMWRRMKRIGDDSLFNTHYATLRTAPVGPGAIEDEA